VPPNQPFSAAVSIRQVMLHRLPQGLRFLRSGARQADAGLLRARRTPGASRIDQLIALRRSDREDRKVGIVLFNFPPNGGNTGTAAYLSVFRSLFNVLKA
jgi:hypothetical protein